MARPKGIDRRIRIGFNATEEEAGLMAKLAAREGVDVSTYLRTLVYREAAIHLAWTPMKSPLFASRLVNAQVRAAVESMVMLGASPDAIDGFLRSVEPKEGAKKKTKKS